MQNPAAARRKNTLDLSRSLVLFIDCKLGFGRIQPGPAPAHNVYWSAVGQHPEGERFANWTRGCHRLTGNLLCASGSELSQNCAILNLNCSAPANLARYRLPILSFAGSERCSLRQFL